MLVLLVACTCGYASASTPSAADAPCPRLPDPSLGFDPTDPTFLQAIATVDGHFAQAMEAEGAPGMVAQIVVGGKVVWFKGYGKANISDPTSGPPTADSLVMIASITKVFTAALMYAMEERGIVLPTDHLVQYMKDWSVKGADTPITLGQLASHTAGLPRETPFPCSFQPGCTDNDVISAMAERYVVMQPSTRFHYSNLGFALLGRALAHAANEHLAQNLTYEQYMEDMVLSRLGMHATFSLNSTYLQRLARGVDADGKVTPLWKDTWDAPCGGLFASASDVAALMSQTLQLANARSALTPESVRQSLSPVVLMDDGVEAVGSPWEMRFVNSSSVGYWIKSKQGSLPGYRSSVALVPQLGFGIFTSMLVSETVERSVYTFPALDTLVPVVERLLAAKAKASSPPMPEKASQLVGEYYLNASVWIAARKGTAAPATSSPSSLQVSSVLLAKVFGSTYRLTSLSADGEKESTFYPVRVHAYPGTAGLDAECRWLDDGSEGEIMYFDMDTGGGPAKGLTFMASKLNRV